MTRKRPTMPAGLDAMLGATAQAMQNTLATRALPVDALTPGRQQPRRTFDQPALEALADSIRAEGVLQPLLVRPVAGGHEIVAGERRWRAAQLAGLREVPVFIRELDDRQALAAGLMENLQRQDLNVMDEVDAKLTLVALTLGLERDAARTRVMQLLREEAGPDHTLLEELFRPLGESWTAFAKNKLRVLNWPAPVVEALRKGLPRTLASLIVSAPEAHHPALLKLGLAGATREQLQAEISRLPGPEVSRSDPASVLARKLSSRRFLASLTPDARKALDRWIAKMPAELRTLLDD
ncbi:ParB/RepB/Spo0J family partition protein [Deinococcus deserti]|uniref:Putative chromosome partitioning, ParB family n=1 Tax=Deinococcus deserti (strain DSM 17065 / CIP 109153 / LMG 22923 / VCD115) TaxID=546414 RepID=C1D1V2_DEIDV|nr:ParB/RepB/Spo0J family partition protein [Deinococcus deserti]ACO47391.1 putative chromosome partitioning, ParB family [Deinococcus deserti VCD115]